jgi:hypothetical protein
LQQGNVDSLVCINTSVLPCPGSSPNYEGCMEAEVENAEVENVFDGDCLKATRPSH